MTKKPIKFVYIAGPYTNGGVSVNVRNAIFAGDELSAKTGVTVFIPHLCHLWDLIVTHEYEYWMKHDLAWLSKCDALLRLPGQSKGADLEVAEANRLGIPVFFDMESAVNGIEGAAIRALGHG